MYPVWFGFSGEPWLIECFALKLVQNISYIGNLWVNGGFPDSSVGKESACNAGDPGSISGFRKFPWRRDRLSTLVFLGYPGGSDGKESACNMGDLGLIPGLERSPGGGHGNPLQYSCLENPHGQRSLVDYSSRGLKESDMTEWFFTFKVYTYFIILHSTFANGWNGPKF